MRCSACNSVTVHALQRHAWVVLVVGVGWWWWGRGVGVGGPRGCSQCNSLLHAWAAPQCLAAITLHCLQAQPSYYAVAPIHHGSILDCRRWCV